MATYGSRLSARTAGPIAFVGRLLCASGTAGPLSGVGLRKQTFVHDPDGGSYAPYLQPFNIPRPELSIRRTFMFAEII